MKCGTDTPGELVGPNDSTVCREQREDCGFSARAQAYWCKHTQRALVSKRSANWKPQLTDTSKMTANSILAAVKVSCAVGVGNTQNWFHCRLRKIHPALSHIIKSTVFHEVFIIHHQHKQFVTFTIIHILRSKTITIHIPTITLQLDTIIQDNVVNLQHVSAFSGHLQGGVQQRKIQFFS